ncbi:MAG TPA: S9 family peptidase [Gaiellaceae bacterium]|jgi:dipeptidyl aminopeptidase/acylaminoacyl peptidase
MRPEDVYALTSVDDPRLSPDGRLVAYVVTHIDRAESAYRSAIWVVPIDGSAEPRRFTSSERRDTSPRWSPDGKWLAFVSNRDGDDEEKAKGQLYVTPADGGEPRKLTDGDESVEAIAWSPDSSRIAFARRVRDLAYTEESDRKRAPRRFTRVFYKLDSVGWVGDRRKHLLVVGIDEGDERQLTDGDCENDAPAWSPDGTQIAFSSMRGERWDVDLNEALYVLDVDADGAQPRRLTADDETGSRPSFSPDGALVAYYHSPFDGTSPHHAHVAVVPAGGGECRVLTASLDRNCQPYPTNRDVIWDDGRIVFAVEDGGNVHLYSVAPDGSGDPELLVGGEQSIGIYDAVDGELVYTASTYTRPHELCVKDDRRVTNVADAFAAGSELVEPERFTAISADGTEVDAWLVRPAGFEEGKSYPTLLTIHGGPFTQYGTGFFDEVQVYAGAGYAVLYSNPRGGSGHSEAWGRAIRGPIDGGGSGWGGVDYDDLMGVVDTALETFPFLDADRLGVLGGSYGGYMTSWIVGHTHRFKAALSERAVNSLTGMYGSSDIGWVFRQQFGGEMWENMETYLERSPATYAQNIETPVLVLHSENDLRCNIEQGELLFNLLRVMGKDVEMVRFPAESHELSRSGSPVHRVMRFDAILEWFGRYLSPGG